MASITFTRTECPNPDALRDLVEGRTELTDSEEIAAHIEFCQRCQDKMESLALDDDQQLAQSLTKAESAVPPADSAYWKALGKARAEPDMAATQDYTETEPEAKGELKLDFLQPSAVENRIGTLGEFEIIRVIGRGGMGAVLQAFDTNLHREVAIKILDPQFASNDLARQRFCREARSAAAVTHENLVAVHQVNEEKITGLPYIVMQYVKGESLEQRLRNGGALSVYDTVNIAKQAAAGLASAHAHGLIHRDIKPGNILINEVTGKVLLTDFGLARATEDMKLTRTGFVAGTPLYMAPEQASGESVDARSDLFSFGSVIYEMLSGAPPFDGKTPLVVLRRVTDERQEPIRKLNDTVPEWLELTIDKLLAKKPDDRFQSASELYELFAEELPQLDPECSKKSSITVNCNGSRKTTRRSALMLKSRPVCYKTASIIASAFMIGLIMGGVSVYELFGPSAQTTSLCATVSIPGEPIAEVDQGPAPEREFQVNSGAVRAVALSADGMLLATGSEGGFVQIWDVTDGTIVSELRPTNDPNGHAHSATVWAIEFADNDQSLITASDDNQVKVWDMKTFKSTAAFPWVGSVRSAAVTRSGKLVVLGDQYGDVGFLDLAAGGIPLDKSYKMNNSITGVAFSEDEKSVASVASDGSMIVYDITMARKRYNLFNHKGPVYGVAFSHDGTEIATGGWDKNVVITDLGTSDVKATFKAHDEGVTSVAYSPCGRMLATSGDDGCTKIWNIAEQTVMKEFAQHKGPVHVARFSRDGKTLATGGRDGKVLVWKLDCAPTSAE